DSNESASSLSRQILIADAHSNTGTSIDAPAPMHSRNGGKPASSNRPTTNAPTAMVNIASAWSAEKTRPRNRSSVLSCNRVVENTHTIEPPQCASTIHAHAIHTFEAKPRPM